MRNTIRRRNNRPFVMVHHDVLDSQILTRNEKWILIFLLRHADSRDEAFPSLSTLARECSMSRSTVQKTLDHLIELRILDKIHRFRPDGGYTSNLYLINDEPELFTAASEDSIEEALAEAEDRRALERLRARGYDIPDNIARGKEAPAETPAFPGCQGKAQNETDGQIDHLDGKSPESPHSAPQRHRGKKAASEEVAEAEIMPEITLQEIREQLQADDLEETYPEKADQIRQAAIMVCEAANDPQSHQVAGRKVSARMMRDRLQQLRAGHVLSVIRKWDELRTPIRHQAAYLRTMLYNEPLYSDYEMRNHIRSAEAEEVRSFSGSAPWYR